jgi:cell division protein ZapA (FtsZ GTPase activity inhibitor)
MNEKVEIEIAKRRLTVEMEGLTPLQIMELARQVQNKLDEAASHNPNTVDTSKLAILAALEMAAELHQLRDAQAMDRDAVETKLSEFALALKSALSQAKR